jgi:hypothetical protein
VTPRRLPFGLTTGTPETRRSERIEATSFSDASGGTVTTFGGHHVLMILHLEASLLTIP